VTRTPAGKPGVLQARRCLYATWGRYRAEVASVEDARARWEAFRDASGAGASKIGNGLTVVDEGGEVVALISYNGRIWREKTLDRGAAPVVLPDVGLGVAHINPGPQGCERHLGTPSNERTTP
jgi:hypothetical protein